MNAKQPDNRKSAKRIWYSLTPDQEAALAANTGLANIDDIEQFLDDLDTRPLDPFNEDEARFVRVLGETYIIRREMLRQKMAATKRYHKRRKE